MRVRREVPKVYFTEVELPESDPQWTLRQWKAFINRLIAEHGGESIFLVGEPRETVSLRIRKNSGD